MLLLIDKPKGMTSHDVVDRVRRITGERRVGHGGTLDPNASGLLIVGVGRESTKLLGLIAKGLDKTYEAEITLGQERDTDDIEGKITAKNEQHKPSNEEVNSVVKRFSGEIEQIPPQYSALKLSGKKAYELARAGKIAKLEQRIVTIHNIKLEHYGYPILRINCRVSSGTYIRALARDIGRALSTGAYLSELRRTQIGKYSVEQAVVLSELNPGNWQQFGFAPATIRI